MRTHIIYICLFLFIGQLTCSQKKESKPGILIREEVLTESGIRYIYRDENWNKKFEPGLQALGYDLIDLSIDTLKVSSMVREEIKPGNLYLLNKNKWRIHTNLSGDGRIISVSFWFKDESGIENSELTTLARRIINEVQWKLYFNKEVSELFYLQLSIPGPVI